jgi:hypothetical protein
MLKNQSHEWQEHNPDGAKRVYRATWDNRAYAWRIEHTLKDEVEWHRIATPDIELLETLRDVLFRKYQRKKLNFKIMEHIDKLIKTMRDEAIAKANA